MIIRIRTRYIPPSDTTAAHIRAVSSNGRTLVVPYDYSSLDPHKDAAEQLHGGPVRFVDHTDTEYRFAAG